VPAEHHGSRLDRPVLHRRMADALERGALMVTGPPGGGKATALEAVAQQRGAVAWVTCEPRDGDPGRLLATVVGAILAAAPGAADPFAARMAAASEPVRARAAARRLAAELVERLAAPLTLVIDRAEHLAEPPALDRPGGTATDVVRELVAAGTPHLRVALASTVPLDVPAERIGTAELAFTREECVALLGAEGEQIHAATGGWPLGVAVAASMGMPARPGDPLDEHVGALLARIHPAVVEVLVDSVAALALDPAVMRALQPPEGFLETVRGSGLPQRESAGGLVLHPLVREVLVARLEQERPSEYRELLHARLGEALEAAGRGADAVEHWLEVPDEAAAAVARHGGAVVDTAPATVARWLARIDGAARLAPELQLIEGRLAAGDGRLLDAPGPLRHAILGFEARMDEASAWGARLALSDALGMLERFDAVVPLAAGFERSLAPAAPMVAVNAAAALAATGSFEEAVALFERAVEARRGAPFAPFAAAFRATWVDVPLGELDAALARVRGAVAVLRRDDPFGRVAHMLLTEAVVLEERGELEIALETALEARALGEQAAPGGAVSDLGRRLAARVLARLGLPAEADAELDALEGPGSGWYAGDLHVTRALIASARGDFALAVEQARRAVEAGALRVWRTRARSLAALVPVLAAAGEQAWARELLDAALAEAPARASIERLSALRAGLG
jgi:ATP/maltotriose-dependent transcriptional regulator MalT